MISKIDKIGYSWNINNGQILATAIHHGHSLSPGLSDYFTLDSMQRLREEDPFTGSWTEIGDHQLIVDRSRFECDLNRSPELSLYRKPEDAWGLDLYNKALPDKIVKRSLEYYNKFYDSVDLFLNKQIELHKNFLVIDIHSYNHRRSGPNNYPAPIENNPDINLGTFYIRPKKKWKDLILKFEEKIKSFGFSVKHDVPFKGGDFPQWINKKLPGRLCALTVEIKKIYMDEWTGEINEPIFNQVSDALKSATDAARRVLINMD